MNLLIDEKTLKEDYVDQVTVAQMLKVTQGRISQLCSEGRFEGATKIGWSWIIPKIAVENFKRYKRGKKSKDEVLTKAIKEADNLKEGDNL